MDTRAPSSRPSLQSIVATLLWSLSAPEPGLRCPRQLSMALHQLRFVLDHPETEPLLHDVASSLVAQLEDALAHCMITPPQSVQRPAAARH